MGFGLKCCLFCLNIEETIAYVLKGCFHAKKVWKYVIHFDKIVTFYISNFYDWLKFNLQADVNVSILIKWLKF